METIPSSMSGKLRRYWRRRHYRRVDNAIADRKHRKIIRLGGKIKRSWRIKAVPKLRLRIASVLPLKLWSNFKSAYINMMLNVAGNVSFLNNGNAFAGKRISKSSQVPQNSDEFEDRLVFEIYKSLMASKELGTSWNQ